MSASRQGRPRSYYFLCPACDEVDVVIAPRMRGATTPSPPTCGDCGQVEVRCPPERLAASRGQAIPDPHGEEPRG